MKISIFFIKLITIFISLDSTLNNLNIRKLQTGNQKLNITQFGGDNYRFTKVAKYSNGDMIAFSAPSSGNSHTPYFYGLKNNGRPYFIKDGLETCYKSLNSNNNYGFYNYYDEGEILVIKTTSKGEEYIINIERFYTQTELYDFENNYIYKTNWQRNLFLTSTVNNVRGSLINIKGTNYFLYGGIFYYYDNWSYGMSYSGYRTYLILYKFYLYEKGSLENESSKIAATSDKIDANGNMVSCSVKDEKDIVCIYIYSTNDYKYKIVNYDENLKKKKEEAYITSNVINENIFFKCLHFYEDIFAFIYYKKNSNSKTYPIVSFKKKIPENFLDLKNLELSAYVFNTSLYLNDFILLPNNIFCFSTVSTNQEILYIVTLTIAFDKIKIRYYSINTFESNKYKFYRDLRLNFFKESIVLASSFCEKAQCQDDTDAHKSSLIIFNYPNSIDFSKDIIDELFERNQNIEDIKITIKLSDYVFIENNIFGLVYSKILINSIDNCNTIKLSSSNTNEEINIDSFPGLSNNENIIAEFLNYNKFDCKIGFTYAITEPDLETFNNYAILTSGVDDEDYFNNNKNTYTGRLSYYNLYLNDFLTTSCSDNCGLCYDNSEKKCIVCLYNHTIIDKDQKIKTCQDKPIEPTEPPTEIETEPPTEKETEPPTEKETQPPTEKETEHPTEKETQPPTDKETEKATEKETEKETSKVTQKEKIINALDCINEKISSSDCSHITVENDEYKDMHDQVINKVLNKTTYNNEKVVYNMENLVIQVSKYDDQDDEDKSIIDLGKCEEILRIEYTIPEEESLIIYKSDIKSKDSFSSYIDYEIYDPRNLEPLNLSLCSEEEISISVSLNLSSSVKSLIGSSSKSGHNLLDKSDPFYNDVCIAYTAENGRDMSMKDKQNILEDSGGSLNVCQKGCTPQSFNITTQKAKCICNANTKKSITNLNEIEFNVDFIKNIFGGLKYSNYLVLKCYKLLLDFSLIKKNIGFILMGAIFIFFLVLFLIYIIKGRRKIEYYIEVILKNKLVYINNRKKIKSNKIFNNKKNNNKSKNLLTKKNKKPLLNKNIIINKKKVKKGNSGKLPSKKNAPPIKKKKIEIPSSASSLKNMSKTNEELNKNAIKNLNINIIPIHNINYRKSKNGKKNNLSKNDSKKNNDSNIYNIKNKKIRNANNSFTFNYKGKNKKILDIDNINYQTLNIQELNNLDYYTAILIDKRSFFQYYCGLIRKKQLIIYAFIPIEDYNLFTLKISFFLLSFSLYLCVNAFFFNDNTMHQLYTGKNDLLVHIPIIIYSFLISSVVNTLLKQLSLSENSILSIKIQKKMKVSYQTAKEVKIFLRIKFIIFFVISFILTIFFWYFISCFCAVYVNTQTILIEDSLISFGLSMFYPFLINIIPGFFRIPSLRAKNQNKMCLYKVSQLLALI